MPESKLAHSVSMGAIAMWFKDSTWWEKIDLDKFDIQGIKTCVVGQYFTEKYGYMAYEYGLEELGIKFVRAHEFGFDTHNAAWYSGDDDSTSDKYWEAFNYRKRVLDRMWKYVIRAERARFEERVRELERKAAMRRHPSYKG